MADEPAFHDTTERVYRDRLPEFYRAADADQGYAFKRFIALPVDQFGEVEDLVARVDEPDDGSHLSELVDPDLADAEWLAWFAQHVGLSTARAPESFAASYGDLGLLYPTYGGLDAAFGTYADQAEGTTEVTGGDYTETELRAAIRASAAGEGGSTNAIEAIIAAHLTGTQAVAFDRQYLGDRWTVRVRTFAGETPAPWRITSALAKPFVVPAGVELFLDVATGASYGELDTEFGTYADAEAALVTYADSIAHVPA